MSAALRANPVAPTVVVGASLAGLRAVEGLRRRGHRRPITVIGEERQLPYDRPPLSKQLLTGRTDPAGAALAVAEGLDVDWRLGTRAVGLDLQARQVLVTGAEDGGGKGNDDGETVAVSFDQLVIATGCHARLWPAAVPPGVHVLRTLDDGVALAAALAPGPRVVIVGGGFIGLEVAAGCRQLGLDTTVVEPMAAPVVRGVGEVIGTRLAQLHRDRGVALHLSTVAGFTGTSAVEGVVLGDGRVLPADLVVVGIGAVPSTGWLDGSGIDLGDGVVCDDRLRVLAGGKVVPGVVAAGDVARWWHAGWGESVRLEHWTNATEQGDAAARTLLESEEAPAFVPVPYVWSDQYERKLQVVGRIRPDDDFLMLEDQVDDRRLLAAFGRHGRLVAAVGLGRPAKVMALGRGIGTGAVFPPGV